MVQDRHQTYCKHNGSRADRSPVSAASLTAVPTTTSLTTVSAGAKGHEYSNSSCTRKRKKKTASLLAAGPSKKKQKTVERKLTYEKTAEELEEETAQYIKEQLKPKVPPPKEKVPLELGKKLLASLDNPPQPKSLPSDYERTLTKAHKVRNMKKKCGKTIPHLGT